MERMTGPSTVICCSILLCLLSSNTALKERMSDPATDIQNMVDYSDTVHSLIPPHFVMQEDPASYDETPGHPLDPNDFREAEQLNKPDLIFDESANEDPILMAQLFQGDIRISSNDELLALTTHASVEYKTEGSNRNAVKENDKLWKGGVIPYQISSAYNKNERAKIARAIDEFHRLTCIRFISRRLEEDYIYIKKENGCSSFVGRIGGKQTISFGDGCIYIGIIMHELLHAVGFWHEQSRADRNEYITIMWDNIKSGMEYNFQKYDWNMIQSLGVSYDLGSIMHYGERAFAKDRSRPTIVSKYNTKIGQRDRLSNKDLKKINLLYNCQVKPTTTPRPPSPTTTTTPPGLCFDNDAFCIDWAHIGECDKNPLWMLPNCRKSCNQCGGCLDHNEFCFEWSQTGECWRFSHYMEYNCRKSCNLCGGGGTPNCIDQNKYCEEWAKAGECAKNPSYMKEYCKKSCGAC